MAGKASLEGSLGFISLADIFQILGGNTSTGVLEMTTPYAPQPARVFFVGGNPVNATCGSLSGVEAVYALFGWVDARFEFREEEVRTGKVIKQARMQIVLDALRMLDDGVIQKVGPAAAAGGGAGGQGAAPEKTGPQLIRGPLVDYGFIIGEEEFHEGERIIKEGGHGKWIWVILEGSVEVSRLTQEGPLAVARLGEGCFIGTFEALMYRENPRTANVNTLTPVRLGLLDTERLSKVYTSFSPDLKTVLTGLDRRLRKVTDRAADLFIRKDSLKGLIKDKGVVMEKGTDREDLFTILQGEALIMGQSKKGVVPLLALGKEDIFGLVPFLDIGHEPRGAAVVGSKDLKTRSLDVAALQREYNQIPATFRNLVYHLGASIFTTTRLICSFHEAGGA